jgi:hypothetical protein
MTRHRRADHIDQTHLRAPVPRPDPWSHVERSPGMYWLLAACWFALGFWVRGFFC